MPRSVEEKQSWVRENWQMHGLMWGVGMTIGMTVISPLLEEGTIDFEDCVIALPIWLILGLAYGRWSKHYLDKKAHKSADQS